LAKVVGYLSLLLLLLLLSLLVMLLVHSLGCHVRHVSLCSGQTIPRPVDSSRSHLLGLIGLFRAHIWRLLRLRWWLLILVELMKIQVLMLLLLLQLLTLMRQKLLWSMVYATSKLADLPLRVETARARRRLPVGYDCRRG
jgi:hypothetical protein